LPPGKRTYAPRRSRLSHGDAGLPDPDPEPRVPFSLSPKDSSFYPLFTASAQNLVAATDVLSEFIHDHARREELGEKLRELEHQGDQSTHAIFRQLNTSFVTPFDREDIYNLASDLDDVMDFVEAAADLVILTGLGTLPAEMNQQTALLQRAAQTTAEAMPRLRTLNKDLSDYWIEVNRIENEADKLYRRLLSRLYSGEFDALEILKLKEVADQLEEAADAFEHVANVVETIAVKES
jgi:predicted phosphate transport protein (TIGR00153 family)